MLLYFFGFPLFVFLCPRVPSLCEKKNLGSIFRFVCYLITCYIHRCVCVFRFLPLIVIVVWKPCCAWFFCLSLLLVVNGCWVFEGVVLQGRDTLIDFVCPYTLTLHVPLLSTFSGPCAAVTTRRCRRWILTTIRLATLAPRPWARHWGTRPSSFYCRVTCMFLFTS